MRQPIAFGGARFVGRGLLIVALVALAACSNAPGQAEESAARRAALGQIVASARARLSNGAAASAPAAAASPRQVRGPLLEVVLPAQGAQVFFAPVARNGSAVTWQSAGLSLTTRGGVLIATRGFGPDLMAADPAGLLAALARGGGKYRKVLSYLDGEDQRADLTPTCALEATGPQQIVVLGRAIGAQRYEENCIGADGLATTNIYWLEGSVIRASQQWVSREFGSVIVRAVE
ncbi:MAG: YjbF family lipoprotein [Pseudomonadota bacterium]